MWINGNGSNEHLKRWFRIIGKQFLRLLLLLLCAALVCFLLVSASPVDPLAVNVGQAALGSMSQEQIAQLRAYWGADTPVWQRFLAWGQGVLSGDPGTSLRYRQPVAEVLGQRLGPSLLLLGFAWLCSGLLGFLLGMVAGLLEGRWPDRILRGYALFTASTPVFWLALMLLLVFSVWLPLLPLGLSTPIGVEAAAVTLGDRIRHAILPAAALTLASLSAPLLHTREKTIGVMHSDYVLFARARGEKTGRIALAHVSRNALLPALTLQGAALGEIIGGSVLVEQVFSYPGLGQAVVTAGLGGDVPLLLTAALLCCCLVFLGNGAVNLLYVLVDPRIRKGGVAA